LKALLAILGLSIMAAMPLGAQETQEKGPPRAGKPLVIAHRGASGYLPEHTLAAYRKAIEQGADFIEPDLVSTRDGVLVARHENEIGATTDVASHPEFAARRTTKSIDGEAITGWFTEDFTLAELKSLRARERIPNIRPGNTRYDGQFEVPTFEEVLKLVKAQDRRVGIYPETKHPSYFAGLGLALEEPLVALLEKYGYRGKDAPVFIQSFEAGNLQKLARMTDVPLLLLMMDRGRPWDFAVKGDRRTYADLAKPAGLAEISTYARGIGVHKDLMIPRGPDGALGAPTTLVRDAHAKGLVVHGWTFRAENHFLPKEFRSAHGGPQALGDLKGEIRKFLALGMDGLFADHPDIGVSAR
jgi:glycerophosphoryl diester phosphodiesterase